MHARATAIGWFLLGFALGGFFDGILLHQILQWHHLLSGVGDRAADLPFQIMADGLFHLAMYLIAIAGGAILLRAWARGTAPASGAFILCAILAGFGIWHITDAVLSHWLLGLHRIRQDAANPLAWDIGWLAVFGIVPLLLAFLIGRGGRGGTGKGTQGVAAGIVLVAGIWAAAGPLTQARGETLVLFRPGMAEAGKMEAVLASGGRLKWADASGAVWAVSDISASGMVTLYRKGAMLVGATPVLAGCLAWTRSEPS